MTAETQDFVVQTTLYHPKAIFGPTGRALPNLDRLAAHFVANNYFSIERAPSIKVLAHALNMDRSHVFRLVKDRAGFVKVITIAGTQRTIGWYYEQKFYQDAFNDTGTYYPGDTTRLGARQLWSAEQVVTMLSHEPEAIETKPETPYHVVVSKSPATKNEAVLIETVLVDEARLTGAVKNLGVIAGNTRDDFMRAFTAIRNGTSVDLEQLESNLVVLASLYQWLRKPHEPEEALLLHDILSTL